jgi:GNAT superfamily N-acetyltransferase
VEKLCKKFTFPWTSYEATKEKWLNNLKEQELHNQICFLLLFEEEIIGYASLKLHSDYSFFHALSTPEIHDVWIEEIHRKKGFGRFVISHLEKIARDLGYKTIGLGVGLYKDYGPAQRLYFHMGYCPDGNGITYANKPVICGKEYPIDDDLVLWLKKDL